MTVTFPFKDAKEIVAKYQWLIGKNINTWQNKYPIKHIVITPSDEKQWAVFLDHYRSNYMPNNMESLNFSGFDPEKVRIILLEDLSGTTFMFEELDVYLTQNNIKKEYTLGFQ